MKHCFIFLIAMFLAVPCFAGEVEYRPGGKRFAKAWQAFYVEADHEPEIDDPLIAKGRTMVPIICEAIKNKDMKRRRYAIGALGYIHDRRALPTLEEILNDSSEIDYFRGDALRSIYQIDRTLGQQYAKRYQSEGGTLQTYADAVLKRAPWLLQPSKE